MTVMSTALIAVSLVSVGYWTWALWRAVAFLRRPAPSATFAPPVSVLKPLRGDHARLYESLRSFCVQDYPAFQIVFGVADSDDPAVAIVRRLIAEFPALDVTLVVDGATPAVNPKVGNVASLYKSARHDVVVLADSDVRVQPGYLRAVVSPLADRGTGLVTCLYRAAPTPGIPSALGALYIDDWFFPSALVGAALQPLTYAFGATIAVRRDVLDAVGGFASVADYLADDYMLGAAVIATGHRIELSEHVVETIVDEPSLSSLLLHEVRWARTIRSVRPIGYVLSLVTFGLPLSLLALASGGLTAGALTAVAANLVVRIAVRAIGRPAHRRASRWREAGLVVARDALSLAVWALAFCGRGVRWYGARFSVGRNSLLRRRAP
jgi:ceramide glucosyltransferase